MEPAIKYKDAGPHPRRRRTRSCSQSPTSGERRPSFGDSMEDTTRHCHFARFMLSELTHTPLRAPHRSGGVDSLMLLSQQVRRFPEVQQGQHFGETVVVDGQIKEKAHLDACVEPNPGGVAGGWGTTKQWHEVRNVIDAQGDRLRAVEATTTPIVPPHSPSPSPSPGQ